MLVFRTCIHKKISKELATAFGLGQHTFYGTLHQTLGAFSKKHRRRYLSLSTLISAMVEEYSVVPLFSDELYLVGITNDDVVATITVRRVIGLALPSQELSHF